MDIDKEHDRTGAALVDNGDFYCTEIPLEPAKEYGNNDSECVNHTENKNQGKERLKVKATYLSTNCLPKAVFMKYPTTPGQSPQPIPPLLCTRMCVRPMLNHSQSLSLPLLAPGAGAPLVLEGCIVDGGEHIVGWWLGRMPR